MPSSSYAKLRAHLQPEPDGSEPDFVREMQGALEDDVSVLGMLNQVSHISPTSF